MTIKPVMIVHYFRKRQTINYSMLGDANHNSLFSFPGEPGEISFDPGDIITHVDQIDEGAALFYIFLVPFYIGFIKCLPSFRLVARSRTRWDLRIIPGKLCWVDWLTETSAFMSFVCFTVIVFSSLMSCSIVGSWLYHLSYCWRTAPAQTDTWNTLNGITKLSSPLCAAD